MRRPIIFIPIILILIFLVTVIVGHPLVNFLDNFFLSDPKIIPIDAADYYIFNGELILQNKLPSLRNMKISPTDVVTLVENDKEFKLGIAKLKEDGVFNFIPDSNDKIQFSYRHSSFFWITPFEMNFMTGHTPSRKRNLYYDLLWTKSDGTELRIKWKFQQWKYRYNDWGDWSSAMIDETSLIKLVINGKSLPVK